MLHEGRSAPYLAFNQSRKTNLLEWLNIEHVHLGGSVSTEYGSDRCCEWIFTSGQR